MVRRIEEATKRELDEIFDEIDEGDKNVPLYQKLVYNFQGRKSSIIAKKVIEGITKPRDIVFDPFFGSGSFLIGSAEANRKIIGTELDNFNYEIVKNLLTQIDLSKLNRLLNELTKDVGDKVLNLYETRVKSQKRYIRKLHFDPIDNEYYHPRNHRDIKQGQNIILEDAGRGTVKYKKFDKFDEKKLEEVNKIDTSRFPNHKFIENSRINITSTTGADRYDTNFTNRAKAALLYIQDGINKLEQCVERDVLEFALVSSISLSKIAMYGDGTNNLYHVILYSAQERNVWTLFTSNVQKFINYKKRLKRILQKDFFAEENRIRIFNDDYEHFLIQNNLMFDCIYTDPPYSDQVPYIEYSQYYRDWLRIFYDSSKFALTDFMLKKEIVETNAPSRRSKNFENYIKDIDHSFKVLGDHLKDNGFLVLTLKLGTARYFKVLTQFIESARKNGFELAGKYAVDNVDPTIRKQAAYTSVLIKQMIVFFQKMPEDKRYWYVEETNMEYAIKKFVYKAIDKSPNKYVFINDAIETVKRFMAEKLTHVPTQDELNKINEIINSCFSVVEGFVHFNSNELYLGLEDTKSLLIKLYDVIPVLIRHLLASKGSFNLDDLYSEIALLLLDGDPSLIQLLNTDPHCKSVIQNLIDNYCDLVDEKYVKKVARNIRGEDAVDISTLDGYELEQLMKELLDAEGYLDVIRTGKSGDRGVDLIATEKLPSGAKQKVIFQCKRWIGVVGSTPIQRLHSMMTLDSTKIKRAVCVTTSSYSQEAIEVARLAGVELVDGQELINRLQHAFGDRYYHGALQVVVEEGE